MKYKPILAILIVLLAIGITFFVRITQTNYVPIQNNTNNSISPAITENSIDNQKGVISIDELSKHDSLSDCWIAYNEKVYDITSFLPRHQGSAGAILPYCGSADEFQKAFTRKHGTSKVNMLMRVGVFIGDFDVMGSLSK